MHFTALLFESCENQCVIMGGGGGGSTCTDCNMEKTATAATQAALPNFTCQGLNKLHYNWAKPLDVT